MTKARPLTVSLYSVWIIFPAYICYVLGRDLVQSLRLANTAAKTKSQ